MAWGIIVIKVKKVINFIKKIIFWPNSQYHGILKFIRIISQQLIKYVTLKSRKINAFHFKTLPHS